MLSGVFSKAVLHARSPELAAALRGQFPKSRVGPQRPCGEGAGSLRSAPAQDLALRLGCGCRGTSPQAPTEPPPATKLGKLFVKLVINDFLRWGHISSLNWQGAR